MVSDGDGVFSFTLWLGDDGVFGLSNWKETLTGVVDCPDSMSLVVGWMLLGGDT